MNRIYKLKGLKDMSDKLSFLTLKENVIDVGKCTGCGGCVCCPLNLIEMIGDTPEIVDESKCTKCEICVLKICPRIPESLADLEEKFFERAFTEEDIIGIYNKSFTVTTKNDKIKAVGQDGGVVTSILACLLEEGEIDCVIASKRLPGWGTEAVIVNSIEELYICAGTRYTLSSNLKVLREAIQNYEKIAVVGTPCQIQTIRRLQKNLKRYGKKIKLAIGLFCTEVFTYDGLIKEKIQDELKLDLEDIEKMNIKGKFIIYPKKGDQIEIPLKALKGHIKEGCHYCTDFSAEYADISVGGVGSKLGWSSVLVRTPAGENALTKAIEKGWLEAPKEISEKGFVILKKLSEKKKTRGK